MEGLARRHHYWRAALISCHQACGLLNCYCMCRSRHAPMVIDKRLMPELLKLLPAHLALRWEKHGGVCSLEALWAGGSSAAIAACLWPQSRE